jgi:hypothetical protein
MITRDFLLDMSDGVFGVTWRRLEGLTDAELVWEPAPNCWSVRERGDGTTRADWAPYIGDAELTDSGYVRATRTGGDAVHPPPLTNLAWRIWHLTGSYANSNVEQMLFRKPSEPVAVQPRRTSAAALADLSAAQDRWRGVVASVRDDELDQPVAGGRHAGQTKAGYVLNVIGHLTGHGAELGVLRDLYAQVHRPDPLHADTINLAEIAWAGMWHAMPSLIERAVDAESRGVRALHLAAAAGENDIVERLLRLGADADATCALPTVWGGTPSAKWPGETPTQWAEHFGRTDVVEQLHRHGGGGGS